MQRSEVEEVRRLWTSLAKEAGQLKVDESEIAFMKQIYGQLAKLLQTRTGRDIIGYIDARQEVGKDKPVIIVPKLPTHLQPKSETESSYAVPTPSRTLLVR